MLDEWLIVVPARRHSQRLPDKPLLDLAGKPLILRVCENLSDLALKGALIVVATDDQEIFDLCQKYDQKVQMTSSEHKSGTDRCLEVAKLHEKPFILNVQGDEPFIKVDDLLSLMSKFGSQSNRAMGTLIYKSYDIEEFSSPNHVKAVVDDNNKALYFSRAQIPFNRANDFSSFWHHLGTYAFSQQSLEEFCQTPQSILEKTESLEQLRALSIGMPIYCIEAKNRAFGIDTPEDLEKARNLLK